MELAKINLGDHADAVVTVGAGKLVLTIEVEVKAEADALLDAAKAKLPPMVQPLMDMIKAGVDSALA
jgi:hypothetical protein